MLHSVAVEGSFLLQLGVAMSDGPTNPYAPTLTPSGAVMPIPMDNDSRARLNAVIKDANQFWIAILLCIVCSGIASFIIGIWYLVRLLQWNGLAKKHPLLMDENAPPGSLAAKFQGAKVKLIVGLIVGVVMLFLMLVYIALLVILGTDASV